MFGQRCVKELFLFLVVQAHLGVGGPPRVGAQDVVEEEGYHFHSALHVFGLCHPLVPGISESS